MSLTTELFELAQSAGAAAVGVTGAGAFPEARERLEADLRSGLSGPLGFTYGDPSTAADVRRSFPWAESLFVFGVSYIEDAPSPGATGPAVARFATEDFYRPLRQVAATVSAHLEANGARAEILIDDNRLVDRSAAIRAGIGWLGRSTMVLAPGVGPWMLLGSVATDAVLEPSRPMERDCGTCTACIPACPTGAIRDGVIDARRCLSTWLQTPGSIPMWIRPILGRRIYGCDDCLTSCPPGHPSLRNAGSKTSEWSFSELLAEDDHALLARFGWWFVPRRDGRFIRRNLLVAAGNSGESEVLPALIGHLRHPSSMIRGHAAWAVGRSGFADAETVISAALENERTPEGREAMLLALVMLGRPELYSNLLAMDRQVTTEVRYVALGLCGADLSEDRLPVSGLEPVVVERSTTPVVTPARLANAIRVNDRERVLEQMRRRAREKMTRGRRLES